jgi:hypothetical protein
MNRAMKAVSKTVLAMACSWAVACRSAPADCGPTPSAESTSGGVIGLSERLAAGRLRTVNRHATALSDGDAVRVNDAPGVGLVWIEGTDVADGTIEADVCGRDIQSESFAGIEFHRQRDDSYEAVYLRPFNFRSSSAERVRHAVQYVAMPDHDIASLRRTSPGAYESAVDSSVAPSAWNHLRIVTRSGRAQVFVGQASAPALDMRGLQSGGRGAVGLDVDNGSDGAFANLRISPQD